MEALGTCCGMILGRGEVSYRGRFLVADHTDGRCGHGTAGAAVVQWWCRISLFGERIDGRLVADFKYQPVLLLQ